MIHPLILNTLMACQPKVPIQTHVQEVNPNSTETNQSSEETTSIVDSPSEDEQNIWPSSLPEPVGLDDLPPMKPASIPLSIFTSEVSLSDLSFYSIDYYQQFGEDSDQIVCEAMCEMMPYFQTTSERLNEIDFCQIDLIDNWKEVVGAVHAQGREELLPKLNIPVGVVECSGSTVYIMRGRTATRPTQCQEMDDDWGGYFATLAQEEATAVFAFDELLTHLRMWDAPIHLQKWCAQIIQDEQRHALMMSGLACRNGQDSAVVHFPKSNRVSLKEMTLHNALTGCIGETWSAVELMYQSEQAPKYNAVFKRIAQDETTHAEFSWALHDWLMSKLSDTERVEVLDAMRKMLAVSPPIKCDSAISMGEMDAATMERAWRVFAQQVETMVDEQRVA